MYWAYNSTTHNNDKHSKAGAEFHVTSPRRSRTAPVK